MAYLEKLRSEKHTAAVLKIQKRVRGWLARRRYAKLRRAILATQRLGRGFLARQYVYVRVETADYAFGKCTLCFTGRLLSIVSNNVLLLA